MNKKLNQATLLYNEQKFFIWQDEKLDWCFNYLDLQNVNTGKKELQAALNSIYETIREKGFKPKHMTGKGS
jgi:hypothetical protein